jgi:hypothetical protein
MATLQTPMALPSSPRPPSRPRMNSALTLVTPEKAQALLAPPTRASARSGRIMCGFSAICCAPATGDRAPRFTVPASAPNASSSMASIL